MSNDLREGVTIPRTATWSLERLQRILPDPLGRIKKRAHGYTRNCDTLNQAVQILVSASHQYGLRRVSLPAAQIDNIGIVAMKAPLMMSATDA